MGQKAHEKLYGVVTHYTIGVSLAFPYVGGWELLTGEPASPVWAIVYGIATTAASWFIVYPSMGFGMFGLRSPEGLKASLSSLANHLFFGMGIAAGLVIM